MRAAINAGIIPLPRHCSHPDCRAPLSQIVAPHIASTTGEAWLRENRDRFGVAEIKSYDTKENLFLDTFNGRIDGAVHDLNAVRYAMTKMKGLQVVERFPSTAQLGMMLKKDSPLTPRLNAAIGELKKDGTLAALWRKWLGSEPDAGSSTVTVLPLPRAQ